MVRRMFRQAWDRYGRPRMTVVHPIEDWNLPIGFSYDRVSDSIRDASGTKLSNYNDYLSMEYIYIIPVAPAIDLQVLLAAGEVSTGTTEVGILAEDIETVRDAFAVEIRGQWYNIQNIMENPIGAASVWSRVRLERRS